jgi:hypothetical protein
MDDRPSPRSRTGDSRGLSPEQQSAPAQPCGGLLPFGGVYIMPQDMVRWTAGGGAAGKTTSGTRSVTARTDTSTRAASKTHHETTPALPEERLCLSTATRLEALQHRSQWRTSSRLTPTSSAWSGESRSRRRCWSSRSSRRVLQRPRADAGTRRTAGRRGRSCSRVPQRTDACWQERCR